MRTIGWFFLFLGLIALAFDIYFYAGQDVLRPSMTDGGDVGVAVIGDFRLHAIAEYWQAIHANSLVGFSAWLERTVGPETFATFLLPILSLPAFVAFFVLGAVILLLFRGRRR